MNDQDSVLIIENSSDKESLNNDSINNIQFTYQENNELNLYNIKLNTHLTQLKIFIKKLLPSNINDEGNSFIEKKLKSIFDKIINLFDQIFTQDHKLLKTYEQIIRKGESEVRSLYRNYFILKCKNNLLENDIEALLRIKDEYDLIRSQTGLYIENGIIVNNARKENEIFILRQENSKLKNIVRINEIELEHNKTILNENASLKKENLALKIRINKIEKEKELENKHTYLDNASELLSSNNENVRYLSNNPNNIIPTNIICTKINKSNKNIHKSRSKSKNYANTGKKSKNQYKVFTKKNILRINLNKSIIKSNLVVSPSLIKSNRSFDKIKSNKYLNNYISRRNRSNSEKSRKIVNQNLGIDIGSILDPKRYYSLTPNNNSNVNKINRIDNKIVVQNNYNNYINDNWNLLRYYTKMQAKNNLKMRHKPPFKERIFHTKNISNNTTLNDNIKKFLMVSLNNVKNKNNMNTMNNNHNNHNNTNVSTIPLQSPSFVSPYSDKHKKIIRKINPGKLNNNSSFRRRSCSKSNNTSISVANKQKDKFNYLKNNIKKNK